MITAEQAIERLFSVYESYGISREHLERIFSEHRQDTKRTYDIARLTLANMFNEREYFSLAEIAGLMGTTAEEILLEIKKNKENKRIMESD